MEAALQWAADRVKEPQPNAAGHRPLSPEERDEIIRLNQQMKHDDEMAAREAE